VKKQIQNFNKSDLAIILSRKFSSLNDDVIDDSIDLILQKIINTVALNGRVEIRGFGVFSKKNIRPRKFTNPKTKEESYLGETSTLHFKASKSLEQTFKFE
jgi:integration host factor subunit beta